MKIEGEGRQEGEGPRGGGAGKGGREGGREGREGEGRGEGEREEGGREGGREAGQASHCDGPRWFHSARQVRRSNVLGRYYDGRHGPSLGPGSPSDTPPAGFKFNLNQQLLTRT